jgi:peptide/nickel transport system permease protein
MYRYILKRLAMMVPVLLGVLTIVFFMSHIAPGDPATQLLGENATTETIAALRAELGLDKPILEQYASYIWNLVTKGDLGISYQTRQPVILEVTERFPTTFMLAVVSMLLAAGIGVPIGIISATKQYSWIDNISMVVALTGVSMPNFWQGLMNILIFSVYLKWLPATGFYGWQYWILPALTIGTSSAASICRMTRSSMLEVIRQDYIRTARVKGQSERLIIMRHALKNALIPIITVIGIQFGYLLGGAVLTETVFAIPGLGKFMVDAIKARNYPVVQGGVLFLAMVFSFTNLFVDILYAFADPRIKSLYKRNKTKNVPKTAAIKA